MTTRIRGISQDELDSYIRAVETGFGHHSSDEGVAGWGSLTEVPRALAVLDGDEMVATSGAFSLDVTVPGGAQVKAAGVTAVTVRPTHRRQGLLRQMMTELFEQAREREEPLAVLTASESHIYGRFGYGIASFGEAFSVATDRSAFRRQPEVGGRFRLVDEKTVRSTFPAIHDLVRRRTPGDINRTDTWWDLTAADAEFLREGKKPAFRVLHEDPAGTPDGYAIYRYDNKWPDGNPAKEVSVDEVVAPDPEVELALWRYLLDLDLVGTVKGSVGFGSPLRWALVEPRRYVVKQIWDGLWVRILDVPTALAARTYAASGSLVLEVADAGTYRLEVDESGEADCQPHSGDPELALGVEELGSVYLGGVRPTTLWGAGRASGDSDALRRADAMFASEKAPYLGTGF